MKQTINIGTTANDGTGDQLRDAFDKTNQNFDEIYAGASTTVRLTAPATSVGATGDLAGMIAYATGYIYICDTDYDGVSDIWQRIPVTEDVQPW